MIGLATAAMLDTGVTDARPHLFVARADRIATLVLSKRPFTAEQLRTLRSEVERLGFGVLLAPDQPPSTALLAAMIQSKDIAALNKIAANAYLDLTVPTDNRPFFFNQLRLSRIPEFTRRMREKGFVGGVIQGNLLASAALALILFVSLMAVICTILLPLRGVARSQSMSLIAAGSTYFSLIGLGFMLAEIALLQYFSIYLGHPIYSLGVCLFSLILATGLGSLAAGRFAIATLGAMLIWGLVVAGYLLGLQQWLTDIFHATNDRGLSVRIGISLIVVMPLGFLLGFAFPTGMKLVEAVDTKPTPWFWGMNGAMGVLASALAVILSMAFGIHVTLLVASLCYLGLIPTGCILMRLEQRRRWQLVQPPVQL
jgi:hypothetical protein